MSFAESLTGAAKKPGSRCGVSVALASFTGKDHAALVDALADCGPGHQHSYSTIVRALKAEKHIVGSNGVSNHINGQCSCGPR